MKENEISSDCQIYTNKIIDKHEFGSKMFFICYFIVGLMVGYVLRKQIHKLLWKKIEEHNFNIIDIFVLNRIS